MKAKQTMKNENQKEDELWKQIEESFRRQGEGHQELMGHFGRLIKCMEYVVACMVGEVQKEKHVFPQEKNPHGGKDTTFPMKVAEREEVNEYSTGDTT